MTEDSEEREFSDFVEEVYPVFNEHTEELGFISKVQIEQAEERDQLYVRRNDDDEVVAAAIIRHCVNKPQTTLQDIATKEEARGMGLAKDIIEEAAEDSTHPYMYARCPVDLPSNNFYEKMGWELVETEEGKNRDLNLWRLELIETADVMEW